MTLAILAALTGYIGTLITSYLATQSEAKRHSQTLEVEKTKQEGVLILDAIKTRDGPDWETRAAANLLFLADAKLITLDDAAREKLRGRAGNVGPGLPSAAPPRQDNRWKAKWEIPPRRGASIGVDTNAPSTFTLGCLVVTKDNKLCILTTNLDSLAGPGENIVHPGPADGGNSSYDEDVIGTVTARVDIKTDQPNKAAGLLARTRYDKVSPLSRSGVTLEPTPIMPAINMVVRKEGRTTLLTRGRVGAVNVGTRVAIAGNQHAQFEGTFHVSGDNEFRFSEPGDSGAIVIDETTSRPVGMIIGLTDGGVTVVMPLERIIQELGIKEIVSVR